MRSLPEAREITSYIGQGMPRFVLSFDPELPDPAFAQIVVQTADSHARDALRAKVRRLVDEGRFPEARVRVLEIVFGPPVRFPVAFRVVGPDLDVIRSIPAKVAAVVPASALRPLVPGGSKATGQGERVGSRHVAGAGSDLRLG